MLLKKWLPTLSIQPSKEFLNDNQMSTRAKLAEHMELYPNQDYTAFDASFKSPVATYLSLMRRASVLFSTRDYTDTITNLVDLVSNTVLKVNPVSAGESLRALTYPPEAYRVMKLPKTWAQKEEFIKFIPFFLPRFVLDYHNDNNENYEICTMNSCELKGTGFEEFMNVLTPAQE